MVVKAFVNSIENDQIGISIPSLEIDNIYSIVLRYPGFSPNFNVGQVVCVDFINGDTSRPIILGTFQKETSHGRLLDATVSNISINKSAKIGDKINFNNINYDNIKNLANITSNIQSELENKLNYISELSKELSDILNKFLKNSENISNLNEDLDILENTISKLYVLLGSKNDKQVNTIYGKINILEQSIISIKNKLGDFKDTNFMDLLNDLSNAVNSANNARPGIDDTDDDTDQESPGASQESPGASQGTTDDEKYIWNTLYKIIKNPYGVAGVMGNMYAESGLKSNNLEDFFQSKFGYTDESYTAAVDNGTYTNFARDSAGYGLVQWTFWTIKQDLYDYAKSKKTSIGDVKMQLECMCKQISGERVSSEWKKSVWEVLLNAKSVSEASTAFLLNYERPANMGNSIIRLRASYAQTYYDRYAK